MIWLKPLIYKIEALLEKGTPEALTYAALECRLALERVAYDRLRISYDYVSEKDFARRWTPKQVIDFLIAEANETAASEFTLSIGREAMNAPDRPLTAADFSGVEWLPVGTQVGFDPRYLGALWQALSSFLHVRLPRSKSDELESFSESGTVAAKVREVLNELRRLAAGTLISSGLGAVVSFECRCGMRSSRRQKLLKEGDVVTCSNPLCLERYRVHIDGDEYSFERVTVAVSCRKCGEPGYFAEQEVINIGLNKMATYHCSVCGELNRVAWRLYQGT